MTVRLLILLLVSFFQQSANAMACQELFNKEKQSHEENLGLTLLETKFIAKLNEVLSENTLNDIMQTTSNYKELKSIIYPPRLVMSNKDTTLKALISIVKSDAFLGSLSQAKQNNLITSIINSQKNTTAYTFVELLQKNDISIHPIITGYHNLISRWHIKLERLNSIRSSTENKFKKNITKHTDIVSNIKKIIADKSHVLTKTNGIISENTVDIILENILLFQKNKTIFVRKKHIGKILDAILEDQNSSYLMNKYTDLISNLKHIKSKQDIINVFLNTVKEI